MSAKNNTPLERLLKACIHHTKTAPVVDARCPRCRQDHMVPYLKGMREISPGYYRVICENCLLITMLWPRQAINDLAGQLLLPLGLKAEHLTTPPVP